jgi:UDP-3-O-[3-hydroxymyristoyl] glucosamine N-acyltransferase LpxD
MWTPVKSSDIAKFLGADLLGSDIEVVGVCSYENICPQSLLFAESNAAEAWTRLCDLTDSLVICLNEMGASLNGPRICVSHPRLAFVRAATHFFSVPDQPQIHPTAQIHPAATIGVGVSVGAFCVVGKDVVIGDHSVIQNGVVISGRTRIGSNCRCKSNSVIGEDGFGFVMDETGTPHATPHFGGVVIGSNVWIGANCTLERGIFDDTVLEDQVKLDDLVQIGHNAQIGRGARIAAGTIICGSVRVGKGAWLGPNSNVIERRRVGSAAVIGIGSNILTDVPDGDVFVGNPGRRLRHGG